MRLRQRIFYRYDFARFRACGADLATGEFPSSWRTELMRFITTLAAAADDGLSGVMPVTIIE